MSTTRNPRSGTMSGATTDTVPGTPLMCSDETREPLPGTAKTGGLVLALEHSRGWGRDILDGEALGKDLTGRIKRYLKENRAQLQFIRRPGRVGQEDRGSVVLFIADATAEPPTLERMELSGPEALLQVDLSTPGAVPGARRVGHPLLLVCTHGKRDRCCAVKGRPLAGGLHRKYPDEVWESSHTKGHRFAPSMILLPWNYSFGSLDLCGADDMLAGVLAGQLPVAGNRGRGTFDSRGQVAELAVAAVLAEVGDPAAPGELRVETYRGPLPETNDVVGDAGRGVEEPETPEAPELPETPEAPEAPALSADAPDPAETYAAVAAMVPEELRRRAGELMAQRIEMKITGRYEELKALKRQGYFRPVEDYERAVKAAAVAHGVYGKYSRFGKYSAYAAEQDAGSRRYGKHDRHDGYGHHGHHGERGRPEKYRGQRKDAPVLLVTRHGDPVAEVPDRRWTVTLESQRCYPVVSSCGDRPKEGKSWVATGVTEITG